MIIADKKFLAEIDSKANALLEKINSAEDKMTYTGKAYYISTVDGNDLNDGLTPETAIRTLDRIHTLPLESGDAILLQRGCEWRGNGMRISTNGITIAAYGKGKKPIINISAKNYAVPYEWVKTDYPNVWKYIYPQGCDVGHIVCDGKVHCIKKCNGHYGFEEKLEQLQNDLEFYSDRHNNDFVYFYSEQNPGERFKLMEMQRIIPGILVRAQKDIWVDNICVLNAFFGISTGSIDNFHVSNCEFGFIGGSGRFRADDPKMVRLGNGVEMYGKCDDFTVENCYFHDIYDAGVTHQRSGGNTSPVPITMFNVRYESNLFERCIYSIEYFCGQKDSTEARMENILMKDNICRYSGGFGWQRPNRQCRHIQGGWMGALNDRYRAKNYVIENNIFDRSINTILSISADDAKHLPVMKGNTYIQYAGGLYGANFVPYDRFMPYDEQAEKFIREDRGETDAIVAVVPEYDGLCD